ncbi:HxlR family transcriptional regulator [Actinocrispum wychmicini]|uniref:HxlR family transcriptional regulator n=1 Tax=Actinocrispum wychmicini TaxID=1213861 RepID=A0A4R2JJM3_9PSEU|nr:HxlR family transcriptional regulator [Actinocrispum wychmicini]
MVGERWSMLIVRELAVGPRRYSDLLAGLPGIPTNLLAGRLRDLQEAGVISKTTLPPPGVATVYELTRAGLALRPAMAKLRRWGVEYGSPTLETDEVRPAWVLLSAAGRPTAIPDGHVCELLIDGEVFALTASRSTLVVHTRPTDAHASITMPAGDLYRFMSGHPMDISAIRAVTGDHSVAHAALNTLRGALSVE